MTMPVSVVTDFAVSAARNTIMRAASAGRLIRQQEATAVVDYLISLPLLPQDEQRAFINVVSRAAELLRGDMERNGLTRES